MFNNFVFNICRRPQGGFWIRVSHYIEADTFISPLPLSTIPGGALNGSLIHQAKSVNSKELTEQT